MRRTNLVVIAALVCAAGAADDQVLTLATTTSTENSGLLAHIHTDFEKQTGIRVKVIARGTGASLQLARDGNADVVLVHAPEMEEEFVAQGYGIDRRAVMHNDFVIIGPKADPSGIRSVKDAAAALKMIRESGQLFVSRGDNSGTHVKEQSLWQASGVEVTKKETELVADGKKTTFSMVQPSGDGYLSVGQGMGNTIRYATEKQAYTLSDRGTLYALALDATPRTDLVVLCEGDPRLDNPYSVIAVNPEKCPGVHYDAAKKYIAWLTSPETQAMIAAFKVSGQALFHPDANAR